MRAVKELRRKEASKPKKWVVAKLNPRGDEISFERTKETVTGKHRRSHTDLRC